MKRWMRKNGPFALLVAGAAFLFVLALPAQAASNPPSATGKAQGAAGKQQTVYGERKILFDKISALTGIPWYDLAAIDQYERTLAAAKKLPSRDALISISFSEQFWGGPGNPDLEDKNPKSIALFGGKGKDGDGDGLADRNNGTDALYTMADMLLKLGVDPDDFPSGLQQYYGNPRAVQRIDQFAHIYAVYERLDLNQHAFPLPLGADYTYRSTWGASRGWGGRRIHEGTDLFAGYGVPVRSTCYGVIETMGWNKYGGWRVGIRDLNNMYHYFAHLSGFNKKEIKEGDIVKPGQVIGWVGSSGYGKPGTSGKFPPHLHYGLYRDNGKTEWSFDPYPQLRQWEREERLLGRKK